MSRIKCSLPVVFLLAQVICSAQFKIREIKVGEDLKNPDFIFPVFTSNNKVVDKKINDYLQNEILETTTSKTPEKKIFDKRKYISDDSISQSGYNSISYTIALNNGKILSVFFEIETTGAYSSNYSIYFNFDSKTGASVSVNNIFTTSGLQYIKKQLIRIREKEIEKWTKEIKSEDTSGYLEDSSFIYEAFDECNSKADEKNILITKDHLLFYKENCLPHAWGPYEADLDITFTYKELEKYLSDFGKRILFTK